MAEGAAIHQLDIPNIEVGECIGGGGFAQVYRAYDRTLRRELAVKILRPMAEGELRRAFESEAAAHGRLSRHPNIVTIHYAGHTLGGQPYLLMDFVSGGSLRDYLRENGPIPWQYVVAWMLPVCAAVQHVHDNGFLHRDIKPDNILLDPPGTPLLSDLGIACLQDETSPLPALSVPHAAPEALRGERRGVRSDVFSLGTTMYQLLTGDPPFGSELFGRLHRIDDPAPPVPPGLQAPAWLDEAIRAALEPEEALRTASAADVRRALADGAGPTLLRHPTVTHRSTVRRSRSPGADAAVDGGSRSSISNDRTPHAFTRPALAEARRASVSVAAVSTLLLLVATVAVAWERVAGFPGSAADDGGTPDRSAPVGVDRLVPVSERGPEPESTAVELPAETAGSSGQPPSLRIPGLVGLTVAQARAMLPDGVTLFERSESLPFRDERDGVIVSQSVVGEVANVNRVEVNVGRSVKHSERLDPARVCEAQGGSPGLDLRAEPDLGPTGWHCVRHDRRPIDLEAVCSAKFPGGLLAVGSVPGRPDAVACLQAGTLATVGLVYPGDHCHQVLTPSDTTVGSLVSIATIRENADGSWICELVIDRGPADFAAYCQSSYGAGLSAIPDPLDLDAWVCTEEGRLSGPG